MRVSDPADRRNNLILLTPRGGAMRQKTTDVVHGILNLALEGISDEELSKSKDVLVRIMNNLKAY